MIAGLILATIVAAGLLWAFWYARGMVRTNMEVRASTDQLSIEIYNGLPQQEALERIKVLKKKCNNPSQHSQLDYLYGYVMGSLPDGAKQSTGILDGAQTIMELLERSKKWFYDELAERKAMFCVIGCFDYWNIYADGLLPETMIYDFDFNRSIKIDAGQAKEHLDVVVDIAAYISKVLPIPNSTVSNQTIEDAYPGAQTTVTPIELNLIKTYLSKSIPGVIVKGGVNLKTCGYRNYQYSHPDPYPYARTDWNYLNDLYY